MIHQIINDDDDDDDDGPLGRCWRSGQRYHKCSLHIPSQMETVTGHKRRGADEFQQRSVPHTV